jgi:hypothetical protein
MFSNVVLIIMATLRAYVLRKPVAIRQNNLVRRCAPRPRNCSTAAQCFCFSQRESERGTVFVMLLFVVPLYRGWQVYVETLLD